MWGSILNISGIHFSITFISSNFFISFQCVLYFIERVLMHSQSVDKDVNISKVSYKLQHRYQPVLLWGVGINIRRCSLVDRSYITGPLPMRHVLEAQIPFSASLLASSYCGGEQIYAVRVPLPGCSAWKQAHKLWTKQPLTKITCNNLPLFLTNLFSQIFIPTVDNFLVHLLLLRKYFCFQFYQYIYFESLMSFIHTIPKI